MRNSAQEIPLMMYLDRLTILQRIHMHRNLSGTGLHYRQMPILIYIEHHPNCTQQQIANALGLTPSSIALSTKRLEKAGFLTKTQDAANLRCNRLIVSEKGRIALDAAKQQGVCFEQQLLHGIDPTDLQVTLRTLQQMIYNLTGEQNFDLLDTILLVHKQQKEEDIF